MAAKKSPKEDQYTPITDEEITELSKVSVYDKDGAQTPLGELIKGKRSVLIFTRHYFLIINNGQYQPIATYATASSSAYPIYTDPSLTLHKILRFNYNLKEAGAGEAQKDYMKTAGGTATRILLGVKGALGNLQHTSYIGPKSLNGGEVVLGADGKCEYVYRMQNTVDHTDVSELARLIGVEIVPEAAKVEAQEKPATA